MLDYGDPQVVALRESPDMNEHELWQHTRSYFNNFGEATRLENAAATSVPDVLFLCRGLMLFVELKIGHGEYFYMQPYQYGYGVRISHHLRPHFHWVGVWDDDGLKMFAFQRVRTMEQDVRGTKLRLHWAPVWDRMKTQFILTGEESYKLWIDAIMALEFEG